MPYTDKELPSRKKLRKDSVDPNVVTSRTDKDDPSLARPYTDTDEPSRMKLLSEIAEPKLRKSSTDRLEPSWATP